MPKWIRKWLFAEQNRKVMNGFFFNFVQIKIDDGASQSN